jgi:hypothetical protein
MHVSDHDLAAVLDIPDPNRRDATHDLGCRFLETPEVVRQSLYDMCLEGLTP